MSENSNHDTHPFVPAVQKQPQSSVPSGSGVHTIPTTRHNSVYHPDEFSSGNDVAMNGVSAGEQNHQYHYQNTSGSNPRTAYPNSTPNITSHQKWQGYHAVPYQNHGSSDHEHQRHIASPTIAHHGLQYPPTPSWDGTRPISRQQPSLQDPNYAHPHNMTSHSSYSGVPLPYGRPPHHTVEPNAAPSPPNQYPSSPRTPQAIGMNQLPAGGMVVPPGLRQPASSVVSAASMAAPSLNGNHHHHHHHHHQHHHQETQQEQRRDYQHSQRTDYHHQQPTDRNSFVEPVHDSRYLPLSQTSRLIANGGTRRLSGMDMRPGGGDRVSHQFTSVSMGPQNSYYSNTSPLSPGTKLGSMRSDIPNFNRGYQYNGTHSENYRLDDKVVPGGAHLEEIPYVVGLESRLRQTSEMNVQTASAQTNLTGDSDHQEHSKDQHHDDTDDDDDDDEIKRETISRTATASASPTRNVPSSARRDSIDSTGSTGSGKEGSKKRGGPVFTDHNGKQYYEEDVVTQDIAGEVPQGWQIGAGKKCLNKLLPLFKDGLPVFPEWGLTSAGKARQRLPKACASCRTKKIKCVESEQDDTKCQHCVKMRIACSQDEEEKPARKNSKKIPEKKRKKDGTIDQESGVGESASPGFLPLNVLQAPGSRKRKASDDGTKPGGFPKRGKLSRDNSFSMEPLDEKASGMDSTIDNSKSIIRHQQPKIQATSVQREKGLGFATDSAAASTNVTDQGSTSRIYNSRLLADQYTYRAPAKHMSSVIEAPPNVYASPTTSISIEHPVTYVMNNNLYSSSSKAMSVTPTLTSTPPLTSIPPPFGEDPRHSQLPNSDVLEHLVNVYFTYVYSQTYAFLHRQTFTDTLYKQPPVLIFSLCAVAARFSDRFSKYEEDFAEPARRLIFENYDNYSVEVVQSLVHMGLHDFGSSNGDKAWMFCGMAVRMGSALNLNLENGHAKSAIKSPIAREVARRTYWSYYLMDRFNGYGVARPFLTQDHDCHLQLPCNQPSFRDGGYVVTQHLLGPNPSKPHVGDTFMGAMAFLVRVVSIWGNILKQIHLSGFDKDKDRENDFQSLIATLEFWRQSLPRGLEYSNENLVGQIKVGTAGAFVTMHVMWHTSMAYVHRYVRTMENQKEMQSSSSNSNIATQNIVKSIRKTFVHADAVLMIMSHVQDRRNETQRTGDTEVVVNAPFLGQAISDACDITIIRAMMEMKAESGGAKGQKDRVFVGLEWLKELRKYWKPLEGMYKKLRKSWRTLEKSMSQPPSGRMSNVIPSPDSGNGAEVLTNYPMFHFPVDPDTYNLQPGIDGVDQSLRVSPMNDQAWLGIHYYEAAFASSALSLYGIAEAEGGFPQLYMHPDMVGSTRDDMDDMATSLAPSSSVYQTDMQRHTVLDTTTMPLLSQQSFEQMPSGHHIGPQDIAEEEEEEDSDGDDEDEKTNGEDESISSNRRRDNGKPNISTLYFHPSAVLDGKLVCSSGSESSGQESRRPSEAAPKPETNPMDVLHLLVSETVDTHYVSKAVGTKDQSDLGTGRAGAMVPDDQALMGEVNTDNSKDHGIHR